MIAGRVLITGGGGQLASDLEALLARTADVRSFERGRLDVTDQPAVERVFADFRPQVVLNCAAFHNVDVCEREEARAFAVNATAVKRLAALSAEHGARFVHVSTNYVFDALPWSP